MTSRSYNSRTRLDCRARRTLRTRKVGVVLAVSFALHGWADSAHADVFQWGYFNLNNPHAGVIETSTLAPDGAGVNAAPGVNFENLNLTKAYLVDGDLAGASLIAANLTNARAGGINLTNANLNQVNLTDANFAQVFKGETSSGEANLTGANLAGATLVRTNFGFATMSGTNLAGADVRGAHFGRSFDGKGGITLAQLYSTGSYQAQDLSGISFQGHDLSGANFAGQNLNNAGLATTIINANFSGAQVRDASLRDMTQAQLYSTASYQAKDLGRVWIYSTQTGWNFAGQNLPGAALQHLLDGATFAGADLTGASFNWDVSAKNANFTSAKLRNADFETAILTGADFTAAEVRGARLLRTNFTVAQLYSTASYQAHNLTGINLATLNLDGANLAGQNLTGASFRWTKLTGANLAGASVRGVDFARSVTGGITIAQLTSTFSYQQHDLGAIRLSGSNLPGVNLSGQDLVKSDFLFTTLTNADFRNAKLGGAEFGATGYLYYDGDITPLRIDIRAADFSGAELINAALAYGDLTNAKFVAANLTKADLHGATLANADLRGANLSGAKLNGYEIIDEAAGYFKFPGTDLTGANLNAANLTDADFSGQGGDNNGPTPGALLTDVNVRGADARGATFRNAVLDPADDANFITVNGHVAGVELVSGESLLVRDYDGDIGITIDDHLLMDASGELKMIFDADAWGSTISFESGVEVMRGGTLQLTFAPGVDIASQYGRTIDLSTGLA